MDQDNTTWTVARIPGVMRETACTVVQQRTASLDSERGIDDGSEVHEGRRQTVRRELNSQSTGRPRLKLPAFQPDWRKSAVRNDRGDGGNGGIIRSPISRHRPTRQDLKSDLRFPHERTKALHESLVLWEISTLLDDFVAAPAFVTISGRDCKAMATKAPIRVAGKSWPTSASAMASERANG